MLRWKKVYLIITGVIIVAILCTIFFISKKNQNISAGESVLVTVTADSIEDIYGYQFHMNYDKSNVEYIENSVASNMDEITTIFSKSKEAYELVGATMIGDGEGVSGRKKAICEMKFKVKKKTKLKDLDIFISDVNVVQSNLEYVEGVDGWSVEVKYL